MQDELLTKVGDLLEVIEKQMDDLESLHESLVEYQQWLEAQAKGGSDV